MKSALPFLLCFAVVCFDAGASDGSDWKLLEQQGRKALEKSDFTTAEKYYMQASEAAEKFGKDDERYATSLRGLGFAALQLRDYPNADFAYTRLARADGERLGTNEPAVADDLIHLTEVAGYTEQFTRGHESIDAATAIVLPRYGKYSREMGFCLATRGVLEMQENHRAEAETNLQKALAIFERKGTVMYFSGAELQTKQAYFQLPQAFVAQVLNNLSLCQSKDGKYGEAESSLQRALEILEHEYGRNSPQLVTSLDNLGSVYASEKKYTEAEDAVRRALGLLKKIDPAHPMARATREELAKILTAEGKDDEAAKYRE